ncbi:3-oxoacyl-[acyl-carrier protein] reductase [Pseudomonas duriflava]|uniref:3-oxoacyl-[acyl-carrier protein] reductase n=1 Tax=Pseudomonas duriflava TaxID=459528 RepID=A0A562Q700_9PSED|nr:SDR family oxidoreductase [Pseudomonas duriflava]TWI52509.1 3-oxoacyl-[acyl-carrier protein] reductase [Pseudomonas duriflava]
MKLQLEGKRALVTGASSGIGSGIALALAREGVRLALTARDRQFLETVSKTIVSEGLPAPLLLSADLTRPEAIDEVTDRICIDLGSVDIVVNNAGGARPVGLALEDDIWLEAFALNFHAARRITQALLPDMLKCGWGRVINISGSMEPRHLNAASAAKGALHLWAKGLACEVAADGVTVNCIAPGRINSRQTLTYLHPDQAEREAFIATNIPVGYFGEPEDIGHLTAFLASPLAHYMTGAVFAVDGGFHRFAH